VKAVNRIDNRLEYAIEVELELPARALWSPLLRAFRSPISLVVKFADSLFSPQGYRKKGKQNIFINIIWTNALLVNGVNYVQFVRSA
jgi:hypothetical protein